MDESKRVIVECVDDVIVASRKARKLRRDRKNAGFAMVSQMNNPPKTVYKYCVFYFKE